MILKKKHDKHNKMLYLGDWASPGPALDMDS